MKIFSNPRGKSYPLILIQKKNFKEYISQLGRADKNWLKSSDFNGNPGRFCLVPDKDGRLKAVLVVVSNPISIWDTGYLARSLPPGNYQLGSLCDEENATKVALGWALGVYKFERYKNKKPLKTTLVWPQNCDRKAIQDKIEATFLCRDLINTPAEDMGPTELEKITRKFAKKHSAKFKVIAGSKLISQNYPAIHAIGRASDDPPRLVDLTWGNDRDPKVTLVGKGVCFDTGGLDIKSASGMKLMKKDMGGAAHALGVASMIMASNAKVRLRVLIPIVENNISEKAIRPMDVVHSRSGKTIEIGHTDAEGRVILADALFEASSERPDLIINFATLTGAARVSLGTELPALFTNDEKFSDLIIKAGMEVEDPVWRLPLWSDYRRHIIGKTADLTNSPDSNFGGAITAALFLAEFVRYGVSWAHIDLMGWNVATRAGRPEGGEAMSMRAAYQAICNFLD